MKTLSLEFLLVLGVFAGELSLHAQIVPHGEFLLPNESYLSDLSMENELSSCECEGDTYLSFVGHATAEEIRLQNYLLIVDYHKQQYKNWLNHQYNILEEEIENQVGRAFDSFDEAQSYFYKHQENSFVTNSLNKGNLFAKYSLKENANRQARVAYTNKLKLLDYRKNQIRSGLVYNAPYGHFKIDGRSVGSITSVKELANFENAFAGYYNQNEYEIQYYGHVNDKIYEISQIDYQDEEHEFYTSLVEKQMAWFNRYDELDRLNLMQMYLTDNPNRPMIHLYQMLSVYEDQAVRDGLVDRARLYDWVYPLYFGDAESYARNAPFEYDPNASLNYKTGMNAIAEQEMLLLLCYDALNNTAANHIKADSELKSVIDAYFQYNDYSQYAIDNIDQLIRNYLDGLIFAKSPRFYASEQRTTSMPRPEGLDTNIQFDDSIRFPVFQGVGFPDLALAAHLDPIAVDYGFSDLAKVFSEVYSENSAPNEEGYIIRTLFEANGINIPEGVSDFALGTYFYIDTFFDSMHMAVFFEGDLGSLLFESGVALETFLENIAATESSPCPKGNFNDASDNCVPCTDKDAAGNCTKTTWVLDADNDNYYVEGSERQEYPGWNADGRYKIKTNTLGVDCDDANPLIHERKPLRDFITAPATNSFVLLEQGRTASTPLLGNEEQSQYGGGDRPVRQPQEIIRFENAPLGKQTDIYHNGAFMRKGSRFTVNLLEKNDDELLGYLEATLRLPTNELLNTAASQSVDLILNRIRSKQGGVLENPLLGSIINARDGVRGSKIINLLQGLQELLCTRINELICPPLGGTNIGLPRFSHLDPVLFSQLGGTQGFDLEVLSDGGFQLNLYDTFGVDEADTVIATGLTETMENLKIIRGLRALWVLQQQRGYKPFLMKVPLGMENLPGISLTNCQ